MSYLVSTAFTRVASLSGQLRQATEAGIFKDLVEPKCGWSDRFARLGRVTADQRLVSAVTARYDPLPAEFNCRWNTDTAAQNHFAGEGCDV